MEVLERRELKKSDVQDYLESHYYNVLHDEILNTAYWINAFDELNVDLPNDKLEGKGYERVIFKDDEKGKLILSNEREGETPVGWEPVAMRLPVSCVNLYEGIDQLSFGDMFTIKNGQYEFNGDRIHDLICDRLNTFKFQDLIYENTQELYYLLEEFDLNDEYRYTSRF